MLSVKPAGSAGETEQLVIDEPPVHDIEFGVMAVSTVYDVEAATIAHAAGSPTTMVIIVVVREFFIMHGGNSIYKALHLFIYI